MTLLLDVILDSLISFTSFLQSKFSQFHLDLQQWYMFSCSARAQHILRVSINRFHVPVYYGQIDRQRSQKHNVIEISSNFSTEHQHDGMLKWLCQLTHRHQVTELVSQGSIAARYACWHPLLHHSLMTDCTGNAQGNRGCEKQRISTVD